MPNLPSSQELFQAVIELQEENERLRLENKRLQEERLPLYMSSTDLARELGISRMKAYQLMLQPDFPSFKLNDSSKANRRVRRDDFLRWQEGRMRKGA